MAAFFCVHACIVKHHLSLTRLGTIISMHQTIFTTFQHLIFLSQNSQTFNGILTSSRSKQPTRLLTSYIYISISKTKSKHLTISHSHHDLLKTHQKACHAFTDRNPLICCTTVYHQSRYDPNPPNS